MTDDTFDTHVFSDGSCTGNGKPNAKAGFALIFTKGAYTGEVIYGRIYGESSVTPPASNIRGEGFAILTILQLLNARTAWTRALIHTDSEFWINMLTIYMPKWAPTKFDKKKNPDLSKELWKEWQAIGDRVHLKFVRAHLPLSKVTDEYCYQHNKMVDLYAKKSLELDEGETINIKLLSPTYSVATTIIQE